MTLYELSKRGEVEYIEHARQGERWNLSDLVSTVIGEYGEPADMLLDDTSEYVLYDSGGNEVTV